MSVSPRRTVKPNAPFVFRVRCGCCCARANGDEELGGGDGVEYVFLHVVDASPFVLSFSEVLSGICLVCLWWGLSASNQPRIPFVKSSISCFLFLAWLCTVCLVHLSSRQVVIVVQVNHSSRSRRARPFARRGKVLLERIQCCLQFCIVACHQLYVIGQNRTSTRVTGKCVKVLRHGACVSARGSQGIITTWRYFLI